MGKNKASKSGIVYSTDPDFKFTGNEDQHSETLEPAKQKFRIMLDRKQRAGKSVTLITGFLGKESDLETIGKKIKTFCGTGGSVKDGEVIIQGDQRDKVLQWLQKNGYTNTKKI